MATIDEIDAEKDAAVKILDEKILDAGAIKNAGGTGMDTIIHDLMAQRQLVLLTAFNRGANSEQMKQALAVLKAATANMNATAAKMKTATTFIANAAALLSGATKLVSGLKSLG